MTVGEKILGAEAHWMMGRVMPRQFLDGIGEYLDLEASERKDELIKTIQARAEELVDIDHDMVVDEPSKGALAISAVALASFEQLRPLFDEDERRTILLLQHVMGTVLKRPYQLMFQTLSKREEALDKIDKACRKMEPLYGAGWDMTFERPGTAGLRDEGPPLLLPRLLHAPRRDARDDRHVCVRCELDTGDRPRRQRAAGGTHVAAVAWRRGVPIRGDRDRRSAGPLQRHARAALHPQRRNRLIG